MRQDGDAGDAGRKCRGHERNRFADSRFAETSPPRAEVFATAACGILDPKRTMRNAYIPYAASSPRLAPRVPTESDSATNLVDGRAARSGRAINGFDNFLGSVTRRCASIKRNSRANTILAGKKTEREKEPRDSRSLRAEFHGRCLQRCPDSEKRETDFVSGGSLESPNGHA